MFNATIKRRSGRMTRELTLVLKKPPEQYKVSEELTIQMDGREIPAHVEIPIGHGNALLCVA
jgi:hypothetical protein